jgi:hypothetical protein
VATLDDDLDVESRNGTTAIASGGILSLDFVHESA